MIATLRAYDRNGNRLAPLSWSGLSRTIVRNAPGSISADVPLSLITSGSLGDEVYLRVAEDGVEAPDWYVLDDDGDDAADEGGEARTVAIGGKGVLTCLGWAEVYPRDHVPGQPLANLAPRHEFSATPGRIMATLIDRAKARGAIPHISYSFTAAVDSAGRAWPSTYARVYDAGTSLLRVLEQMDEDAWADFEMTGFRLDLYVPDTALARDLPNSVLRLGKGVTQAPRKRTRASVRSVLLAVGNEGNILEVADADATARYGRREGYEGRAGVTDVGTLAAATRVSLTRQTSASESITLALEPGEVPPIPRPGGYCRYDQRRLTPTRLEPMRVQSIAWQYGDDEQMSVELADLWVNRDVRLERRVDAILNGSSANERVPPPPPGDEKPPSSPQGLSLVSGPYEDPTTGAQFAQVTATWLEVTTDVDGTVVDELAGYTIEWRQLGVAAAVYRVDAGAGQTLSSWSPVVPGEVVEARIAAYDRWGNYSAFSAFAQVLAGVDETPPATPTAPIVDNYLGLLRSKWDGAFVGGTARPADLAHVEVHVSATSGFDPNVDPDATRVGTIFAPNTHAFANTPYGQARYVKLVAVDTTGNRSPASAEASAATGPVVSADVFDGAIGTAKLADAAIVSAKIDKLAVNTAQVGSISVGKLAAGTIAVDVLMGGRIATALTGTRVELNSLGIFRWVKNADGTETLTVAIDNNGALITGRYRTALTGRRVEIGAGGTTGELMFVAPDGAKQYVRSESRGGVEALQIRAGTESLLLATEDNITSMWGWTTAIIMRDALSVFSSGNVLGDTSLQDLRFEVRPTKTLAYGNGAGAAAEFTGGTAEVSPILRMFENDRFGGGLRFVNNADGARLETTWWDVSGYIPHWASAFTVQSDARGKFDVADAPPGLLDQVKATKVKLYRREDRARVVRQDPDTGEAISEPVQAPEEIGLLAQEAPPQIVVGGSGGTYGVDLYQMAAMTWGAVAELAARVDQLAARSPTPPGGTP